MPIGFRSSIYKTFVSQGSSTAGTYWTQGISDKLTVNSVANFDGGIDLRMVEFYGDAPYGYTFPFLRGPNADKHKDLSGDEETLECYYEDILENQYEFFYGSGKPSLHCF